MQFGNPLYMLVVVYVYLPFGKIWHGTLAGILTTVVHIGVETFVFFYQDDIDDVWIKVRSKQ